MKYFAVVAFQTNNSQNVQGRFLVTIMIAFVVLITNFNAKTSQKENR